MIHPLKIKSFCNSDLCRFAASLSIVIFYVSCLISCLISYGLVALVHTSFSRLGLNCDLGARVDALCLVSNGTRNQQADRPTGRQADMLADANRQTQTSRQRHTHTQINRQTQRQTNTQTSKQTNMQTGCQQQIDMCKQASCPIGNSQTLATNPAKQFDQRSVLRLIR